MLRRTNPTDVTGGSCADEDRGRGRDRQGRPPRRRRARGRGPRGRRDVAVHRRGRDHRRGPGARPWRASSASSTPPPGPSPDQEAATEFFTTAARNLHEAGPRRRRAADGRGVDHRHRPVRGGYNAAKLAHERAMLSGPIPARILRAAQFHEFVGAARGVGPPGRGELRAEDAHPARRRPNRRRGARRPRRRPTPAPAGRRSRRSPARARRAWSRWRRCSPPGAASRCGSRASRSGRPRRDLRERRPAARPGRHARRPDVRGVARPGR